MNNQRIPKLLALSGFGAWLLVMALAVLRHPGFHGSHVRFGRRQGDGQLLIDRVLDLGCTRGRFPQLGLCPLLLLQLGDDAHDGDDIGMQLRVVEPQTVELLLEGLDAGGTSSGRSAIISELASPSMPSTGSESSTGSRRMIFEGRFEPDDTEGFMPTFEGALMLL